MTVIAGPTDVDAVWDESRPAGREWDISPVLEAWIDPEADAVTVTVELAGTLTAESAAQVRAALVDVAGVGGRDLVVDMSDVDVVDAAGLGVLAEALPRASAAHVCCRLISPSPPVLRVLQTTGLSPLFPIVSRAPWPRPRPRTSGSVGWKPWKRPDEP
jgi:anti-anti-sigma factor